MLYLLFFIMFAATLVVASHPSALKSEVVVLMVMVSFFHPVLVTFPVGYVSNFGNIWYSGVLAATTFLAVRYGAHAVAEAVILVLTWVPATWIILLLIGKSVPITSGVSGETYGAIQVLLLHSLGGALPSWVAFTLANVAIVLVVHWTRGLGQVAQFLSGCVAGQLVDSLIFFPAAFGAVTGWTQIMVVGLVIKLILSVPFTALLFGHNEEGVRDQLG